MTETPSPSQPAPDVKKKGTCLLCSKEFPRRQLFRAGSLRPNLNDHIAGRHAERWGEEARICKSCLALERFEYLKARLTREKGELSAVEQEFARKVVDHQTLAADIERQFESQSSPGQRMADRVAAIGGSWPFVAGFLAVLVIWALVNSLVLRSGAFDPYPYILLNLFLSCLAAIQAPIIMMSQNRVAAHDRMQANQDFRINLKSELEIASLHEKMDHLLHSQWQNMVELQQVQIDLLNELAAARR